MTNNLATRGTSAGNRREYALYLVCGSLTIAILLLDLSIPLGVAMGVPYTAVILISLWFPRNKFTVLTGVVCSLLVIGVYLYKPAITDMWKVVFNRALALFTIWVTVFLGLQRKISERKREDAFQEREKALEQVRILHGLLPICASCKRIRDSQDNWIHLESYITDHSEAEFSHGICPDCVKKLYPEMGDEKT